MIENLLELQKIKRRFRPLFAIRIIDFQMMEIKHHRKLSTIERRILLAMF
ncbi:Uncharacterised protein [Vibrio cholerae]|nr:Uncharacterised protein [Vibrio cholerae]